MDTMIVTGGAGFIGCNFVRFVLTHTDARIVVVDQLTYAGSLRSLDEVAHGFCVTSPVAQIEYKCTDFYDPSDEIHVRWDDPDIGIMWPINDPKPYAST